MLEDVIVEERIGYGPEAQTTGGRRLVADAPALAGASPRGSKRHAPSTPSTSSSSSGRPTTLKTLTQSRHDLEASLKTLTEAKHHLEACIGLREKAAAASNRIYYTMEGKLGDPVWPGHRE